MAGPFRRSDSPRNDGAVHAPVTINMTDGVLIPERGKKGVFSAWRIALIGAILLLILLPVLGTAPIQLVLHQFWNGLFPPAVPDAVLQNIADGSYKNQYWVVLNFVPDGLIVTFEVTIAAIILASFIGLATGLGQIVRNGLLNRIATVYVEVIRGIPLIVQLFFIYYAMGQFLKLEGTFSAILALSICYGAYLGEIFRAGIQSISRGQMEAALALGLNRGQAFRLVVLPQTVRVILPAIGNEFIALLKDSSLVSMLALTDLMQRGRQYATKTFSYFEAYVIVALIYLVITLFLSRLVGLLEERLQKRGR